MLKTPILSKKYHDRDYFFKYVSKGAIVPILQNLEFRWSSPLAFNDPFDTQANLNLNFSEEQYAEGMWLEVGKERSFQRLRELSIFFFTSKSAAHGGDVRTTRKTRL